MEVIATCSNPSPALARILRPEKTASDQDISNSTWVDAPSHPGRQSRIHLRPEQIEALTTDYLAGRTVKALAAQFGVHHTAISRVLKERGITLRLQPMSEKDVDLAIQLYQAGWSLLRVGERLNRSPETIRSELHHNGVAIRDSHGRPQP